MIPDQPADPARAGHTAPAAAIAAAPPARIHVRFHGDGGDFFVVLLKNVLLTLVTLGIYAAWAKTARRRFIWHNIEVGGHRLQYTGTGLEVFKGYLQVLAVYLVGGIVVYLAGRTSPQARLVAQLSLAAVVLPILPFAIYWSRRYVLARTRWRAIRFGLVGEASVYARTFLLGALVSVLTLGLAAPVVMNRLRAIVVNNTRWGSESFVYDGKDKEVFFICLKGFLLSVVTLGIYYFWFMAELQRYQWSHTRLQNQPGRFDTDGGQLFGLYILNLFATTLTLGIAFPWVACYSLRNLTARMSLEGELDFAAIAQRAAAGGGVAEGLADVLGVDLGV